MNRTIIVPFIIGILMVATSACNDTSTKSQALEPNATDNNSSFPQNSEVDKDDAQSEVREGQLESDIRAREERNKVTGDLLKRADTVLASEVRSKLESKILGANLIVVAKDAIVTVSGKVLKPDQVAKIEKLGMQIKGVKSVTVNVGLASKPNLFIPTRNS